MECANCGAEVAERAKFCARCGYPVEQEAGKRAGQEGITQSSPPESAAPAPEAAATTGTVGEIWTGAKGAWSRVGSPELAAASALTALGFVFALVGLALTLSSSAFEPGKLHGLIWGSLASLLALIAVGWFAAASARFQAARTWAIRRDLRVAQGVGAVALVFSLVGLVVSYGSNLSSAQPNGGAWLGFASVWTFVCFGWLILSRPLERRQGLMYAIALGAFAVLFGVVGLAIGLGSGGQDYVRGAAWLGWGLIWAVLGTAALLSRSDVSPGG